MAKTSAAEIVLPARSAIDLQQYNSPPAMLERALAQGAPIDVLERLMAMAERYNANLKLAAFDNAIAAAKGEIQPIKKNRVVDYEHKNSKDRTSYAYEDFAQVARSIDPILGKHGLSYRFRTDNKSVPGMVIVTCVLSHRDGHREENSLSGPNDTSGQKNAHQAIGSSVMYLQRYTLKASLGLAAYVDDDGKRADSFVEEVFITDEQVAAIDAEIERLGVNKVQYLKVLKLPDLQNIHADKFEKALQVLRTGHRGK